MGKFKFTETGIEKETEYPVDLSVVKNDFFKN